MKDRIQYGYDRAGNRTWRKNLVAPENQDQHYLYDPLYQVTAAARGNLNLNQTAIGGIPAQRQTFTYDPTGNWERYTIAENGVEVLNQNRIHNQANQITQIGGSNTGLLYDRAGNANQMPPDATVDWSNHYKLTWDAWNRLVKVENQHDEVLASYAYDGTTRRTTETIGEEATHSFYNNRWKPVEERVEDSTVPHLQYLWGARPNHRDELVRRDRDADNTGPLEEKLYCLMDYFDPISVADVAGNVQERYQFSTFGLRSITDAEWEPRAESEFSLDFGFHGQFLDSGTSYYNYGYRNYSPEIGRWLNKDPIAEQGGLLLYLYASNCPNGFLDYLGLKVTAENSFFAKSGGPVRGIAGEVEFPQYTISLEGDQRQCPENCGELFLGPTTAITVVTHLNPADNAKAHEEHHVALIKRAWSLVISVYDKFTDRCLTKEKANCYRQKFTAFRMGLVFSQYSTYLNQRFHCQGVVDSAGRVVIAPYPENDRELDPKTGRIITVNPRMQACGWMNTLQPIIQNHKNQIEADLAICEKS